MSESPYPTDFALPEVGESRTGDARRAPQPWRAKWSTVSWWGPPENAVTCDLVWPIKGCHVTRVNKWKQSSTRRQAVKLHPAHPRRPKFTKNTTGLDWIPVIKFCSGITNIVEISNAQLLVWYYFYFQNSRKKWTVQNCMHGKTFLILEITPQIFIAFGSKRVEWKRGMEEIVKRA